MKSKLKTGLVAIVSLILFCLNSLAIRHVGNGGGDAEMLLLKQYPTVPFWLKVCQENQMVCPAFFSLDRFELISFVASEDKVQDCNQNTLFISNESLYLNQSTAKSELGVFNELLGVLNKCLYNQTLAATINVDVRPQFLMQPSNGVAVLKGLSRDYFVSTLSEENLNYMVQKKANCENIKFLRVWSKNPLAVVVRCELNNDKYLIRLKQNTELNHAIDVRFFSDGLSDN